MEQIKIEAKYLSSYITEIFGRSADNKEGLIFKNLPQNIKFHIRKLAEKFIEEEQRLAKLAQDIHKKYSEKNAEQQDYIPETKKAEFSKELAELDEIEIEINHYPFTEADFIDRKIGEVVSGDGVYYNIIDKLIYEKQEASKEKKQNKEENRQLPEKELPRLGLTAI